MIIHFLLLIACNIIGLTSADLAISYYTNYEQNLINDIFKYYDPQVPPFNPSKTTNESRTTVRIQIIVHGVKEVDLMDSTVNLKCTINHWWNDTRTSWNQSEYGGIDTIWMKTDLNLGERAWTPDVMIRQDAGDGYLSNMKATDVKITSNGENFWSTIGDVKVVTSFNVVKFPYDLQNITITYGSWIYPDFRLALELHPDEPFIVYNPLKDWTINNIEWSFHNHTVITIKQIAASGIYMRYSFIVFIRRQGGTMLIGLLIPGCLITFLGTLYYFLPTSGGERTEYLATILLTEIMFLVMLTGIVPQSREVPQMAWVFLSYTILLGILTIIVLLINKIYQALLHYEKKYLEKMKLQLKIETSQNFLSMTGSPRLMSPAFNTRNNLKQLDKKETFEIDSFDKKQDKPIRDMKMFFPSKHLDVRPPPIKKPTIEIEDLLGDKPESIDIMTSRNQDSQKGLKKDSSSNILFGLSSSIKEIDRSKYKNDKIKEKISKYSQERNVMKKRIRKIILRIDMSVFICALLAYFGNTIYMIYQILIID